MQYEFIKLIAISTFILLQAFYMNLPTRKLPYLLWYPFKFVNYIMLLGYNFRQFQGF